LPVANLYLYIHILKVTATYNEQGSRKFYLPYKKDEMRLCCREKNLLALLYVFACCFISVAPIFWISLKADIWERHENLLGNPVLLKSVENIALFTCRPEYDSLYSATLYLHKNAAFQ
jgi:hypothetical protein